MQIRADKKITKQLALKHIFFVVESFEANISVLYFSMSF